MEAGEENVGNTHLKRQRTPLSDSEDNVFSSPGLFALDLTPLWTLTVRHTVSPHHSS